VGIVKRPAHLARIETGGRSRRGGGAEGSGNAVRRQTALVAESGASHCHDHTGSDVVAQRHGAKQTAAVNAVFLAGRQCRRHNRAARMRARFVVRVVGFIGVRHDAIGKRGIDRRCGKGKACDRRCAFGATFADVTLGRLSGRQFRSGDHRCQRIEQMVFGVFGDIRREGARSGGAHVGAQRAHHGSGTRCLGENARRQGECRGGRRRHAENVSSVHRDPNWCVDRFESPSRCRTP
jgi:hypothetical protein